MAPRTKSAAPLNRQGYEASIDKNIFAERTVTALSNTMDADRADLLERLIVGMVKDTFDYGLDEGVGDVLAYHRYGAFASSSGTVKEARERELRTLRRNATRSK